MKYCPTCQTQFEGDEVFCPHDGTKLFGEPSRQPGRLAGSSLEGLVNLEAFLFSDHLGERYRGRLLSDNKHVRVTVFHRRFSIERVQRAASMGDELELPLPPDILSVHSVQGDTSPVFLIEEQPEADSLARLLKKKGPLPWEQALFLALKVARILQWLADAGLPSRSVHRRAIFVDNPKASPVQLGEWFVGLMTFPLPAIEDDTPTEAIPIYPSYIAPEWLIDDDVDLERAAVFTTGAVLLDALGIRLVDDDILAQAGGLRGLLQGNREQLLATLPRDAPEAMGDLIAMMIAPTPDKRFHKLPAAMRALASLLDTDPDRAAPPLEQARTSPFEGQPATRPIPMPDVDDDGDKRDSDSPRKAHKTQVGLPAAQVDDEGDDSSAAATDPGVAPRVIIDDPADDPDDDALPKQTRQTARMEAVGDETDDGAGDKSPSTKETLLMGAVNVSDERAEQKDAPDQVVSEPEANEEIEDDSPVDDEQPKDRSAGGTLLMNTVGEPERSEAAEDPAGTSGEDPRAAGEDDGSTTAAEAADRSKGGTAQHYITQPDESSSQEEALEKSQEADADQDNDASSPDDPDELVGAEDVESGDDEPLETAQQDEPSIIIDDSLASEPESTSTEEDSEQTDEKRDASQDVTDHKVDSPGDDDAARAAKQDDDLTSRDGEVEIGYVAAEKSSQSGEVSEVWFGRSTEDAWEESYVRETYERSRRFERVTRIGLVVAGIVVVIGAIIFFQAIYEPPEDDQEEVVYEGPEPLTEAELAQLQRDFDEALAAGRLLQPRDESARDLLTQLERHADDDVVADARRRFSEAADRVSRYFEAQGDLLAARNFAGHASSASPDDEDLKQRAEQIHERYIALRDEGENGELEEEDEESEAEASDETPDSDQTDETTPSTREDTTTRSPQTRRTSTTDISTLLAQAREAQNNRDDEKAREKFSAILDQNPNHGAANDGMGRLFFHDGDHRRALPYQRRAVRAAPNNVDYRLQLGMVLYRLGQFEEAIEVWEEVLSRDPDNRTARSYISHAERNLN